MGDVVRITQPIRFSLEEANKILPVVRRITHESSRQFLLLEQKLKRCEPDSQKWKEVEQEIGLLLNKWEGKLLKLGCLPKGIWLVDFDNGEGYYCWRYDEEQITHFHGYQEGFGGRTPIN